MKLQIQTQSLRLRVDEAELAQLLAGQALGVDVRSAGQAVFQLRLALAESLSLQIGADWTLHLPEAELRAYVATLPRRDALAFDLASGEEEPLRLDFEVDVRDSLQVRGPRRRA